MKRMPMPFPLHSHSQSLSLLQGVVEVAAAAPTPPNNYNYWNKEDEEEEEELLLLVEPCSVLDNPTNSTSTSTFSSDVAALSDPNNNNSSSSPKWPTTTSPARKEDWAAPDLQPIPSMGGLAVDNWDAMLCGSPTQEQTFLRWIMGGDVDDSSSAAAAAAAGVNYSNSSLGVFVGGGGGLVDPDFGFDASSQLLPVAPSHSFLPSPSPPPPPMFNQESVTTTIEEKPPPALVMKHHQQSGVHLSNPGFFQPLQSHHHQQQQQQQEQEEEALVDQLLKAAELVDAGNPYSTREILARLNHQLPPSPIGLKPLLRTAFLFKEVLLRLLLANQNNPCSSPPPPPHHHQSNPWDVVLKLSSYKAFSEVSPLLHFTNFTCTQALVEQIGNLEDRIHIVDFDLGVGCQWSSFIQELAVAHHHRSRSPSLKITAFVSPSSFHHPLELQLISDNLSQFAAHLHIPFQFSALPVESFNPNDLLALSSPNNNNEAIAVNLPIGSHYPHSFPTLLKLVKQLNPKVVVSVDQGCDRSDLPFPQYFLHSFHSCMILLDSLDAAAGTNNADVINKIERMLVQPRMESLLVSRHRCGEENIKMPSWRALFATVGFVPVQFSNFTETQAECLLKRVQVRGFIVDKRQGSLVLYWQRGELGSVSAWRCG